VTARAIGPDSVGAVPVGRESRPDPIQPGPTRVRRESPTDVIVFLAAVTGDIDVGGDQVPGRAGRRGPRSAGLRRPALSLARMVYWTISKPETREDRS
jgi:hypothetical protein